MSAQPPRNPTTKAAIDIFAGFCSGITVTIVGHPFETLKVRLQTQPTGAGQIYSGLFDCIKKTLEWEGPSGFYRGVTAPLAGQLFFRSALFFSYGEVSRQLSANGTRKLNSWQYAAAGSFAWSVASLIECPLQLSSSQMQVDVIRQKTIPGYVPRYRGVFDFLKTTIAQNGITGIYQGYTPHLARNAIGGFFHFGIFEELRNRLAARRGATQVTFGENMAAGGIAGFFFWLVTYPIDVTKSAIQADNTKVLERKYSGTIDAVRKLYGEGGLKRFTRGFSACALRALPANAVLLTTATMVRDYGYRWAASS